MYRKIGYYWKPKFVDYTLIIDNITNEDENEPDKHYVKIGGYFNKQNQFVSPLFMNGNMSNRERHLVAKEVYESWKDVVGFIVDVNHEHKQIIVEIEVD